MTITTFKSKSNFMRLWQKAGRESADDYDDDHYDNAGDGEDDDHGHHDPGSTAAKSRPITKSCKNLLPLTLLHLTPDLPAPNFDSRVYFANWTMSDPLLCRTMSEPPLCRTTTSTNQTISGFLGDEPNQDGQRSPLVGKKSCKVCSFVQHFSLRWTSVDWL